MLVYSEGQRLGWSTVSKTPRRRGYNVLRPAVVVPTVDNDEASSEEEHSEISAAATSESGKDTSFSTASKKARRRRAGLKRAEALRKRALMRRARARQKRASNTTVQEKDHSSFIHKGWTADFGLFSASPVPTTVGGGLSVCHKGLSADFRVFLYKPTHPPPPLARVIAAGRFPTRFAAGRRLKRGKVLKERRKARTRSHPKRQRRQMRKVELRRRQHRTVAETSESGIGAGEFQFRPPTDDPVETNFCKDRDRCVGRFVFGNRRADCRRPLHKATEGKIFRLSLTGCTPSRFHF